MKFYVQVIDDEIRALFSSPQPDETNPPVEEIESDDPRLIDFVNVHNIKGVELL